MGGLTGGAPKLRRPSVGQTGFLMAPSAAVAAFTAAFGHRDSKNTSPKHASPLGARPSREGQRASGARGSKGSPLRSPPKARMFTRARSKRGKGDDAAGAGGTGAARKVVDDAAAADDGPRLFLPGVSAAGAASPTAPPPGRVLDSVGSPPADEEEPPISIETILVRFDDAIAHRAKRLDVPAAALYRPPPAGSAAAATGPQTVGFFVKKENSARPAAPTSSPGGTATTAAGILGILTTPFGSPQTTPTEPKPDGEGERKSRMWPRELDSGPYRWVPARVDAVVADAGGAAPPATSCSVSYDPNVHGVGTLEPSRIVADPEAAVAHVRRQIEDLRKLPPPALPLSPASSFDKQYDGSKILQQV